MDFINEKVAEEPLEFRQIWEGALASEEGVDIIKNPRQDRIPVRPGEETKKKETKKKQKK